MCFLRGRPPASLSVPEPGIDSWGESTLHILVGISRPPLRHFLLSLFPLEGKRDTVRNTPFFSWVPITPSFPRRLLGSFLFRLLPLQQYHLQSLRASLCLLAAAWLLQSQDSYTSCCTHSPASPSLSVRAQPIPRDSMAYPFPALSA